MSCSMTILDIEGDPLKVDRVENEFYGDLLRVMTNSSGAWLDEEQALALAEHLLRWVASQRARRAQ